MQVQVQWKVEPLDVGVVVDPVVVQCGVMRLVLLVVCLFCRHWFVCTSGTCLVVGALPALMSSAGLVDGAALFGGGPCDFDWADFDWADKS